jgi:hypothetical protein
MVEAEGGLEELNPRVPAPSRSGRRFGSNGKQRVWWRPGEELDPRVSALSCSGLTVIRFL